MSLSVLIVDDERWMRDTIEKSVDWEHHGFRVSGKVGDGLQAYEMIMELKPDIVLADIKMPGIDGINLLRRLKESCIEVVFIFFSGYDSFEYVKSAIDMGAMGYILKPVDEHELLKALLKAKGHIESERLRNEEKQQFEGLSNRERNRRICEYVTNLLDGTVIEHNISQAPGIELLYDNFMVISIEIDRYSGLQNGNAADKASKLKLMLNSMCADYFETAGIRVFVIDTAKGVEALLNFECSFSVNDRKEIIEICKKIVGSFKSNTGCSVTIGLGPDVHRREEINKSAISSRKALQFKLLAGMGRVLDYKDVNDSKVSTVILDNQMEKELANSFEKSDFTVSNRIIERIKTLINTTTLSLADIKMFNYSLTELVYRLMIRYGLPSESLCSNPHLVYDDFNRCEDMEELFGKYCGLINNSLQLLSDRNLNYYKKLADSVKKYIHEHYAQDISLESVAQELAFHPNYISRIFKEEFGENFIEYLTSYRIAVAKELLRDGNRHNVIDISGRVGYSNPKYFSKVFKKVVGVTPVEYIGKKQV